MPWWGLMHTGCSDYHTRLHADTHMHASNSSNQYSQAEVLCTQGVGYVHHRYSNAERDWKILKLDGPMLVVMK